MSLKGLSLAKYRFTLRTKETLILPAYKGSTLRGGFGSVFHKIICVNKNKDCSNCPLRNKCIYSYIFETSPPPDSPYLSKYKSIPRPFILEPPLEEKRKYEEGDILYFNLILIGRAIDYLPYFIFAFQQLGETGLGKEKARYELIKVEFVKESSGSPPEMRTIYESRNRTLKEVNARIDISYIFSSLRPFGNFLTLRFITPIRIKYQGSYTSHPEFHVILRSLLRRLSSLLYFHCGEELEVDYREMIKEAERIETLDADIDWIDWERYSGRQEQRMKLGGFIGRVTYHGNLDKFFPFLKIGEYIHLGKAAVFGLGKYEIERN
jgi:CRISPR-associated endoribonuclease Cas6